MAPITTMATYKLSNLVLSQKSPFTLNDIMTELKELGVDMEEGAVKSALNMLRDNWIITEQDRDRYCLSIQDF